MPDSQLRSPAVDAQHSPEPPELAVCGIRREVGEYCPLVEKPDLIEPEIEEVSRAPVVMHAPHGARDT